MDKRIAVIDAETDPFLFDRPPKPFIWGFYDGSIYEEFTDTDELVTYLSRQDDCIVFAHNGGKFDFHFMAEHINLYEEIFVVNGRLGKFHIGECEFRDSYLILPIPLGSYQKDEIDYSIMEESERYKPNNWKKIKEYLYGDCVYLHDLITKFIDQYGLSLTMASASMKQWKKISGRYSPRSSSMYYGMLRPYYYGGRVQCFQKGVVEENFKLADINSAYPYAMLHKHPIGTDYEIKYKLPDDLETIQTSLIKVQCRSYGALPYRDNKGGLIFPNDNETREYLVTGWEFLTALATDTIKQVKVKEVRIFNEVTDFSDYINHFYEQRLRAKEIGDKANDIFSKLFMNSLYGKFASNPDKYRRYQLSDILNVEAAESDGYEFAGEFGGWALMQRRLEDQEKTYYNIATSASITGFVRAFLWNAICKCDKPIYCDTDSIAAKDLGDLDFGNKLGQWELELTCDYGAVAGKKLYAFRSVEPKAGLYGLHQRKPGNDGRWKIATKGARLTPHEVIRVASGEQILYRFDAPTYNITSSEPKFMERRITATG